MTEESCKCNTFVKKISSRRPGIAPDLKTPEQSIPSKVLLDLNMIM
jgi:hypothetical protein